MLDVVETCALFGSELIGTAPFEMSMLKSKRFVTSDKTHSIFEDLFGNLDKRPFESSDVGEYQCCLSNEVGKIVSKSVGMIRGQYA